MSDTGGVYDPLKAIESLHWDLVWARLPSAVAGCTDFVNHAVMIAIDLSPAERRSTLAHEVEHIRRGPVPTEPVLAAREERAVEEAAARQLINIRDLAELLAESDEPAYVADALGVDPELLSTRLDHLHPSEVAFLRRRLDTKGPR